MSGLDKTALVTGIAGPLVLMLDAVVFGECSTGTDRPCLGGMGWSVMSCQHTTGAAWGSAGGVLTGH